MQTPNKRKPKVRRRASFKVVVSVYSSVKAPSQLLRYLKKAAQKVLKELPRSDLRKSLKPKVKYNLEISLISNEDIRKINATYRKKNRPTDVLSFSRLNTPGAPDPALREPALSQPALSQIGELLIGWETATRQASEQATPVREELVRLLVHGILHLFGYDHETSKADEIKMFRIQNRIIKKIT